MLQYHLLSSAINCSPVCRHTGTNSNSTLPRRHSTRNTSSQISRAKERQRRKKQMTCKHPIMYKCTIMPRLRHHVKMNGGPNSSKTMTANGEQVIIIMIEVNRDTEHRIQPLKLLKATEPTTRPTGKPAMHPNDTPESLQRPSEATQESPGAP